MAERSFITFLSDFGLEDDFVGTCHGVIKGIAPEAKIIDLSHGIRRHDILQGAIVLANSVPYLPDCVFLAVVDPGVGGQRKSVAIRTAKGHHLVGPDNGLLSLAAARLGGAAAAVELVCSTYSLPEVCKTFEGRDLFSPAAAHLSNGVALEKLGPAVAVEELEQVILPEPEIGEDDIAATVIYIDRFGNIQLRLGKREMERIGARVGSSLSVSHDEESWEVPFVQSFADVQPEELLVCEDSYGSISFAINQGDAGRTFQINVGDQIRFRTIA